MKSLTTIQDYTILKQCKKFTIQDDSLTTIQDYTILKQQLRQV